MSELERWESAWSEYVAAEDGFRKSFPLRHSRGFQRQHRSACVRRRRAIDLLRSIDVEFCDRLAII